MSGYQPFIYHRPSGWARPLEGCELIHPTIKPEMVDGVLALHVDDAAAGGESLDAMLLEKVLLENHVAWMEHGSSAPTGQSKFRFTVEVDMSYNVKVVEQGGTFDD